MTNVLESLIGLPVVVAVLLKLTLVLAIAWAAHFLLRRLNPRWRVLVWRGVLIAILALPFAERTLPGVEIGIESSAPQSPMTAHSVNAGGPEVASETLRASAASTDSMGTVEGENRSSALPWIASHWVALLVCLWAIVLFALLARMLRDIFRLRRALCRAAPAPEFIVSAAEDAAMVFGIRRHFDVLLMEGLGSPFLTGVLRPIILLPKTMAASDDPDRLRAVLAHELAHAKSNDLFWMATARLAAAVLWFHPFVWRLRSAHRSACEEVCDGLAAAYVGSADSYAQVLANEALAVAGAHSIPGGVAMIRNAEIVRRLRKIQVGIRANPIARRWVVAAFLATALSLFAVGSLRLVAAQQDRPQEEFKYAIEFAPYERMEARLAPGDRIQILEVRGTLPRIEEGGRYYVRGKYTLASHESALLHVYAADGEGKSDQGPPVTKGEGEFTRTFTLIRPGNTNVSFYQLDGREGFGKLFFQNKNPGFAKSVTSDDRGLAEQKMAANDSTPSAPDWRARFDAVYRLKDGEVLKHIPPPYIPERADYYKVDLHWQAESIPYSPGFLTFNWDGKLTNWGLGFSDRLSVTNIISIGLQIGGRKVDGASSILDAFVSGDWIVRKSSTMEERLRSLADILSRELGTNVRVDHKNEPRTVVVVRGSYKFTPLPDAPWEKNAIHLYSNLFNRDGGAGGGSGRFSEFLDHLGNYVPIRFLNDSSMRDDMKVAWVNHDSAHLMEDRSSTAWKAKLDQLLNNLHRQTGLDYFVEERVVDLWVFSKTQ